MTTLLPLVAFITLRNFRTALIGLVALLATLPAGEVVLANLFTRTSSGSFTAWTPVIILVSRPLVAVLVATLPMSSGPVSLALLLQRLQLLLHLRVVNLQGGDFVDLSL